MHSHEPVSTKTDEAVNVGLRLSQTAGLMPDSVAVAEPRPGRWGRRSRWHTVTFRELDDDSSLLADGLRQMGVEPQMRLALLVRPGIDFVSLVFALFKAGVVTVLIDPGIGRGSLIDCLEEAEPDGFVAMPVVQAARVFMRKRFPKARFNVTAGRRWFWGGRTLRQLRRRSVSPDFTPVQTLADDPAAIIFTTGSTGPPKGVLYRHGNFNKQVDEIRDQYAIEPGGVDLSGFPLFALFNAAMGVTTVFPEMDFTRPAAADPRKIIDAATRWNATQSFGSPALWNAVGRYCERTATRLPKLRKVFSAGAPVPPHVLQRMRDAMHPEGEVYTPYGATEALPVASISATEVLGETAPQSAQGRGTCVGRRFPGIQWKVIRITDDAIPTLDRADQLPSGEIGELIVRGPVVTSQYATRTDANALHKIRDAGEVWHRMGDVGYLDEQERFWFCGRKSQRVLTAGGTLFTIPCEAITNAHAAVYRSALVGVGPPGDQTPVMIVEPWPECWPESHAAQESLLCQLRELLRANPLTGDIREVFLRSSLPVDIRHNAKIFREQLAEWAAEELGVLPRIP